MKYTLLSLMVTFVVGCSATNTPNQAMYTAEAKRTAQLQELPNQYKVTLTLTENEKKTVISFSTPKKQVIKIKDLSGYTQNTSKAGKPSWSGGGIEEGFIFVDRSFTPFSIEVHALELGDCSCRHVFPYFANGKYQIIKEVEQEVDGNPLAAP